MRVSGGPHTPVTGSAGIRRPPKSSDGGQRQLEEVCGAGQVPSGLKNTSHPTDSEAVTKQIVISSTTHGETCHHMLTQLGYRAHQRLKESASLTLALQLLTLSLFVYIPIYSKMSPFQCFGTSSLPFRLLLSFNACMTLPKSNRRVINTLLS